MTYITAAPATARANIASGAKEKSAETQAFNRKAHTASNCAKDFAAPHNINDKFHRVAIM
ncbi:MAG: hypothetical protein H0U98_05595 [Alphaproteobacteria bacterium]|nr:hypothetical protein [Alphaproteobacteria bacterium]